VNTTFKLHQAFKRSGDALPLHTHDEGQLTYAASGMVQVHTDAGVWLVPPQLAAWIPAGIPHRLDIITDAVLRTVLWPSSALETLVPDAHLKRAFVLRVTPLLRALLDDIVRIDAASEKVELIARLMLHELTAIDDAPTFLPLPTSLVGRRVANVALADTRNELGLAEIAFRAATSVRTASRLFPKETGMTLKAWRQRARIVRAIEQLAQGSSPSKVALEAGFASTAAFSHAFRQVTSRTPGAFIEQQANREGLVA